MALVKVNVRGKDVGDKITFQILLGFIGFFILLIIMGPSKVATWVGDTFIIYTAATLLFFTLLYGFVHEEFTPRYLLMMILGAIILVLYCIFIQRPAVDIVSSVIEALVSAAVFSVIFDQLKKRVAF